MAAAGDELGPQFRRLAAAATISALGDGMRVSALPLLALQLTDDPLLVSGVLVAATIPWLICSLPAGALTDRLDRRAIAVAASLARGLLMAAFTLLVLGPGTGIAILYAVAVLQGVGEVFGENAAFALLPSIVPSDALERANGRLTAATVTARTFAGPALGGLLFAAGHALPFAADAVSFLLTGLLLLRLPAPHASGAGRRRGLRRDIAAGVSWLAHHRVLRVVTLAGGAVNLVIQATTAVLVVFARDTLGLSERGFGLLLGVEAVGILAGGLAAERVVRRLGVRRSILVALGGAGLANLVTAASGSVAVVGAMSAVVAFGGGLWSVTNGSLRQRLVPGELLGRVQSAHRLVAWGAMPAGAVIGGLLGRAYGPRAPFLLAAAVLCGLAFPVAVALRPAGPARRRYAVPVLAGESRTR